MDSSACDFQLTSTGCNYCAEYQNNYPKLASKIRFTDIEVENNLKEFKNQIQELKKRNSQFDCLLGISGGLDSCFALHIVCSLGLNPLVVHMDNGWNSEIAQNNIEKIIRKHNLTLRTRVLKWSEYRRLQLAFLSADVVDIELLYDHAAISTCLNYARELKIYAIVSGTNVATEGFRMPPEWAWINKTDSLNIKDIWKKHGDGSQITDYPFYSSWNYLRDIYFGPYEWISILDRINYDKKEAEEILKTEYGFKPYKYKHYESIFTRFYQGFLLPEKFGIDKRKSHLSSLVLTGKMDHQSALALLRENPYSEKENLESDKKYFLKKIGWSESDLLDYINRKPVSHWNYRTEEKELMFFRKIEKVINKFFKLARRLKKSKKSNLRHQNNSSIHRIIVKSTIRRLINLRD